MLVRGTCEGLLYTVKVMIVGPVGLPLGQSSQDMRARHHPVGVACVGNRSLCPGSVWWGGHLYLCLIIHLGQLG